jgi:hypothetical protein
MMSDDVKPDWPGEEEPSPSPGLEEQREAIADVPADTETFINADGEFVLEETPAVADEVEQKTTFSESEPIWTRLRRVVLGGGYKPDDAVYLGRLSKLSEAIENAPEAVTNYVLRGELYLKAGLYELARNDFQTAAALANEQYERSDWGLLAQAMRDRALIGLTKAEKKLLS